MMKIRLLLASCLLGFSATVLAESISTTLPDFQSLAERFYLGINGGYASTNWSMLTVDPKVLSNYGLSFFLPVGATDTGGLYGFNAGYSVNRNFTVEVGYTHFDNAAIQLRSHNAYTESPTAQTLISRTSAFYLAGKFIIPVTPIHKLDAFASAGLGILHRNDKPLPTYTLFSPTPTGVTFGINTHRVGGTFGAGLIYNFTEHFFTQAAFSYYTGYGKSTSTPVNFYVPFIYEGSLMLAVRL